MIIARTAVHWNEGGTRKCKISGRPGRLGCFAKATLNWFSGLHLWNFRCHSVPRFGAHQKNIIKCRLQTGEQENKENKVIAFAKRKRNWMKFLSRSLPDLSSEISRPTCSSPASKVGAGSGTMRATSAHGFATLSSGSCSVMFSLQWVRFSSHFTLDSWIHRSTKAPWKNCLQC